MPAKIDKKTIKKELKKLGLKKGDIVFVHSSLSALGEVTGGPDAVIDAIIETVGPKGTVAMTRLGGALLSGTPQLPGNGHAEIKELISILRCRSFNGYLSIKPNLAGGKEGFNKAADAFWRLLENM